MTMKKATRGAAVEGNLTTINTPHWLSVVRKPANQRSFVIVRDAEGREVHSKRVPRADPKPAPRKPSRRSATNPVIAITFPQGIDEENARAALGRFGYDSYALTLNDAGAWVAVREDLTLATIPAESTSQIRLTGDGVVATIEGENIGVPGDKKIGVSIARYEFSDKTFDNEKIAEWFSKNGVDFSGTVVENRDESLLCVEAKSVESGTEIRRMEVEPGVIFAVFRDEESDIPAGYIEVVNEAAYGSWGWGILDFGAALANCTVFDALRESMWLLYDVIEQILFYSDLPVDGRKTLADRALTQFSDYVGTLFDTLPRQVLLLASNCEMLTSKDDSMTTMTRTAPAAEPTTTTTTAPATSTVETPAGTTVETPATGSTTTVETDKEGGEKVTLTRADLTKIVSDAANTAVTAAMAARDAADKKVETPAATDASDDSTPITRGELASVVAEAVRQAKGTTVVRSGDTDQTPGSVETNVTRKVGQGMFKGKFGVASRDARPVSATK